MIYRAGGTQIQMLRGYGVNLQGAKTFIRRDTLTRFKGKGSNFNWIKYLDSLAKDADIFKNFMFSIFG